MKEVKIQGEEVDRFVDFMKETLSYTGEGPSHDCYLYGYHIYFYEGTDNGGGILHIDKQPVFKSCSSESVKASLTNRDKVLNYCRYFVSGSIESLSDRDDVEYALKHPEKNLNIPSCPTNWGLEDAEELCNTSDEDGYYKLSYKEQVAVCQLCWKKALKEE